MATVHTVRGPVEAAALGRVPMHERGVTGEQITTMLVDNSRHYFGG